MRNQPSISTLCSVATIFINGPDKYIFNSIIKFKMHVIDGVGHNGRKGSVTNRSMRADGRYDIFDS